MMGAYKIKPTIPSVSLSTKVNKKSIIKMQFVSSEQWQVSTYELSCIIILALERNISSYFEFGTFDGRTTLNIMNNIQNVYATTIDLPPEENRLPDGKRPGDLLVDAFGGENPRLTQLFGNSLNFDFSPYWGQFDLVFIDAGHSYENALADSRSALKLVEGRDAMVIWHDYATLPGVTKAVDEVRQQVGSDAEFFWIAGTSLAVMSIKSARSGQ